MKRLLYLTASVSQNAGGVFYAVQRLCQNLPRKRFKVSVMGLQDEYTAQDLKGWRPFLPKVFPVRGPRAFGYSPGLRREMLEAGADLLHTHGLWMYPSVAGLAWARSTGRPYLVSPHGMLDDWALRHSWFKKKVAAWLFENDHLENATCLHALCGAELKGLRALGYKSAICLVPNGVDLPADEEGRGEEGVKGRKTLLYLGRLHPKKGLHLLLEAARILKRRGTSRMDEWRLALAGWNQGGYTAHLKRQVHEAGLENWVDFVGPQFGEAKVRAYRQADAFILPSYSEGLPIVVLEAWSYRLPVLMTHESNLPEGFDRGAALPLLTEVEAMARSLEDFFNLPERQRRAMGRAGRRLVEDKFSWPVLADRMHSVYLWLLGGGKKPDCVDL